MLRSFRVANHKSLRDEAELLLIPAYDKSRQVTPVAAVFGANASGKSNLLDALHWMEAAVRESYAGWEPGAGVPRTPFRLDPAAPAEPSLYSIEIIIDGSRYSYGVEVDDEHVLEEWLYAYPRNRRRIIFERKRQTIRLGSTLPDHRVRGERLARQTRGNALFLSVAAHNDLLEVQPVYEWFRSFVRFADGSEIAEEELLVRLSDEHQRAVVVELIRAADVGISDVGTYDTERLALAGLIAEAFEEVAHLAEESAELANEVRVAADSDPQLGIARINASKDRIEANLEARNRLNIRIDELVTRHEKLGRPGQFRFRHGESDATLGIEEQSAGTRSWIGLVSAALGTLGNGGLLVVDEVDASLHPHLAARLINLFRDAETNPGGAQLLLTTHDATLLDEETLSRDEIWFVEKEPGGGATRLFPLTDFHPRKNENTEGRYLAGSYGAVPVLSDYRFRRAVRAGTAADAAA